jgi:hypothetical protein
MKLDGFSEGCIEVETNVIVSTRNYDGKSADDPLARLKVLHSLCVEVDIDSEVSITGLDIH